MLMSPPCINCDNFEGNKNGLSICAVNRDKIFNIRSLEYCSSHSKVIFDKKELQKTVDIITKAVEDLRKPLYPFTSRSLSIINIECNKLIQEES